MSLPSLAPQTPPAISQAGESDWPALQQQPHSAGCEVACTQDVVQKQTGCYQCTYLCLKLTASLALLPCFVYDPLQGTVLHDVCSGFVHVMSAEKTGRRRFCGFHADLKRNIHMTQTEQTNGDPTFVACSL